MKFPNIYTLFRQQTAKYQGAQPVFYSRKGSEWESRSWEDFEEHVNNFACALLVNGLTKGASVAILAGNVAEWAIWDIGTIAAGGVSVGLYPTSSPDQCAYIINHSGAEFVLVDNRSQLLKILKVKDKIPKVKQILLYDILSLGRNNELLSDEENALIESLHNSKFNFYHDFYMLGKVAREKYLPQVEETGFNAKAEDIAIMVYTSGTTGQPKGAMLSHQYVLNSVESLKQTIPIFDTDVCFSYLPFCHVAERISGLYNRLYNGTSVYFVDDLSKLYAYMLEVKPTVFASLPRFFEKIYAKVVSEHGTDVDSQTLKDAFGGRIRLATSGGAPLPNEIADFFARNDLPILQAYGLTENICVAFNRADDFKYGTVGKPMPMCEVKIAPDGEILVKSPMMFSGYYQEPEKTAEMFNDESWLLTGDLGALDADGFLKITGRKKEIIVLSNGKNVAPALVENMVKENHLVSQCFLYGDGKSYCVALITLNQLESADYAAANNVAFKDFSDLTKDPNIQSLIEETVNRANARLSSSEQIKRFVILERDFSAEADEITPTLKLKRNIIADRFADVIEQLYNWRE